MRQKKTVLMIVVARMLLETKRVGGAREEVAHVVIHPGGGDPVVEAAAWRSGSAAAAHLVECETNRPAFEGGARSGDSPPLHSPSARAPTPGGSCLPAIAVLRCCRWLGGRPRKTSGHYSLPFLFDIVEAEWLLLPRGPATVLFRDGVKKSGN